ncbi:hypothetical protein AK812_SmicGene40582 [Symbiodinium microadriaticum]|uniref:Uncharacterized protein n=1 Tax=Symbiodinium microadriaticum TaxID=2951 RepID=A0A1Q9C8C0_SYMMI|nr:hypothetical protein AK812_SmicGene40582 [Symbiodinium microadriaticum]
MLRLAAVLFLSGPLSAVLGEATVPAAGVYSPSASDDIDITGKTSRAYAGGGAASSFLPPGEKSRVDQLLQRLQQGISVA